MSTDSGKSEQPSCPECQAGKCGNCDGDAWSNEADSVVLCPCEAQGHPRRTA